VDGKNGLWLLGSGARALGDSLAAAVSDRVRLQRLTTRARRMVKQRYTWTATLRTLETVYGW
jgi:glycosyltransferase involved in cell wall biosynthesis